MRQVNVINHSRPLARELHAGYCSSFFCRLKGLMFRTGIPQEWGLLLVEPVESIVNAAIHMIAVPFDLGVVWINTAGEVVDTAVAKAWVGLKKPAKPARYILEISPSRLIEFKTGERISFEDF